jgi:hypothetical protein
MGEDVDATGPLTPTLSPLRGAREKLGAGELIFTSPRAAGRGRRPQAGG